VRWVSLF